MGEGKKLGRMIYGGLLALTALVLLFTFWIRFDHSRGGRGAVFGYIPTMVISGSMLPTLEINSVNIVKECSVWDVKKGDIIVFWEGMLFGNVIHRVVDVKTERGVRKLVTKGDANPLPDPGYVTEDILVGKVVYIANWMVPVMNFVAKEDGTGADPARVLMVVFPVVILVWIALCVIVWLLKKVLMGLVERLLNWFAYL